MVDLLEECGYEMKIGVFTLAKRSLHDQNYTYSVFTSKAAGGQEEENLAKPCSLSMPSLRQVGEQLVLNYCANWVG